MFGVGSSLVPSLVFFLFTGAFYLVFGRKHTRDKLVSQCGLSMLTHHYLPHYLFMLGIHFYEPYIFDFREKSNLSNDQMARYTVIREASSVVVQLFYPFFRRSLGFSRFIAFSSVLYSIACYSLKTGNMSLTMVMSGMAHALQNTTFEVWWHIQDIPRAEYSNMCQTFTEFDFFLKLIIIEFSSVIRSEVNKVIGSDSALRLAALIFVASSIPTYVCIASKEDEITVREKPRISFTEAMNVLFSHWPSLLITLFDSMMITLFSLFFTKISTIISSYDYKFAATGIQPLILLANIFGARLSGVAGLRSVDILCLGSFIVILSIVAMLLIFDVKQFLLPFVLLIGVSYGAMRPHLLCAKKDIYPTTIKNKFTSYVRIPLSIANIAYTYGVVRVSSRSILASMGVMASVSSITSVLLYSLLSNEDSDIL